MYYELGLFNKVSKEQGFNPFITMFSVQIIFKRAKKLAEGHLASSFPGSFPFELQGRGKDPGNEDRPKKKVTFC